MFELWIIVVIAVVGLFAGLLGGLLGIGGSLLMIPALVVLFGQGLAEPGVAGTFKGLNQHIYQAAAMVVNILVAIPATFSHTRAKAVMPEVIKPMLPASMVAIVVGVAASNLPVFSEGVGGVSGPVLLGRVMAVFMIYVVIMNARKLFASPGKTSPIPAEAPKVTVTRSVLAGLGMGFIGGLLGVGGGAIAVPMQQILLKLPLRSCIANSAAVMCASSVIGAAYKNATLAQHGLSMADSLLIAALLGPTALIGGLFGAKLTHLLPVWWVRLAFVGLLVVVGWKMAAL